MTKVQYFTACTLDGFIADEHHSLDWLFEVPDEDGAEHEGDWDEFIGGVSALVMGATSYEWMVDRYRMAAHPQAWRDFYGDRPGWVFSHRDLAPIPGVEIRFVSGDVRPVYDEVVAATAGDGNIWLVGGGDLVGQFDDAGLLDEVWLGLTPVTLGAGAPLLPRRITSQRMRFREVRRSGQRVRLVLDVQRRTSS